MNITYKSQNNTVRAFDNDQTIGKVSVQDIDLHWASGLYIPMAGIGEVGTDEAYRAGRVPSNSRRPIIVLSCT